MFRMFTYLGTRQKESVTGNKYKFQIFKLDATLKRINRGLRYLLSGHDILFELYHSDVADEKLCIREKAFCPK